MTSSLSPGVDKEPDRTPLAGRRVAVVGTGGMLGRDLLPCLERTELVVVGLEHAQLDITNSSQVFAGLQEAKPDLVINCAAYTAVDRAESESDQAFAVNRDGAAHLAQACNTLHVPLIHISTDYVFDGQAHQPYREDDATRPLGVYGNSKWQGEETVRRHLTEHLIVRTAWLFGVHGHNFVKTILRLAREREELRVVADQHGCPTWTGDLAGALVTMALHVLRKGNLTPWGTYHYCGAGQTTWHGFAGAIVEAARHRESLRVQRVVPISTSEYPLPAPRPPWAVLDCGKIAAAFGIVPRPWRKGLEHMLEQLPVSGL